MIIEQFYLDCLSHASYLVGDETTGRAVVIDPQREVSGYLASAVEHGMTIELVLETHFHADFLSGHLELAARTGATIGFGSVAQPEFAARLFADGERYSLGDVTLQILHTPGHTPESISILVFEHADDERPHAVLTGDTLFIGDVGRPDLLASIGVTADELGRMLYHSLHDKLMALPDETLVYPAHGAGSACGKNLSTETSSTIGEQRRTNYALADLSVDEFLEVVTEGQPPAPGYFLFDAIANRQLHDLLDDDELERCTLEAALDAHRDGAVLLDVRDAAEFARGYLDGSINVGIDGRFAEYAGSVISPGERVIVIADGPQLAAEARLRLGRIGYDHVHCWVSVADMMENPVLVRTASRLTAVEFDERRALGADPLLIDVRGVGEFASGTIDGALSIPVTQLRARSAELLSDPDRPVVVFCAGGYRSSIAASVLRLAGLRDVSDVVGGYGAWQSVQQLMHTTE